VKESARKTLNHDLENEKQPQVQNGTTQSMIRGIGFVDGACEARSRQEEEGDAWPSSTTTNAEIVHNPNHLRPVLLVDEFYSLFLAPRPQFRLYLPLIFVPRLQ